MNIWYAVVTALLTFLSPCVLPLLPVYVTYFAAGEASRKKTFFNALAFCVGISLFFLAIFTTAALLSTSLSNFIDKYQNQVFAICGMIIVLFGLKIMGYLNIPFLNKTFTIKTKTENINIFGAFLLGLVFSFSMGMCAVAYGTFVLIDVITGPNFWTGFFSGLAFVLTLDVLFMTCSMLIGQLKSVFKFIQRHYKIINMVAGILLIVFGVLMALGFTKYFSSLG